MVNFLHISDIHLPDKRGDIWQQVDPCKKLEQLIELLRKLEITPSFTVITGDISNTGTVESYKLAKKYLLEIRHLAGPVFPTMGTKDNRQNFRKALLDQLSPYEESFCYYSQTIEGLHIIAMDSHTPGSHVGSFNEKQLDWLENELLEHQNIPAIIGFHEPSFFSDEVGAFMFNRVNTMRFRDIVSKGNILAVLNGHLHFPFFTMLDGIHYVQAASPLTDSGFNLLNFSPKSTARDVEASRDLFVKSISFSEGANLIEEGRIEAIEYLLKAQAQYGRIMTGKGDWTVYVQHIEKAIEMNPAFAEPYRILANAYMHRLGGKIPAQEAAPIAHAAIEKAIELEPESWRNLLLLSQIYMVLDLNYANAAAGFRKVLNLVPSFGWCELFLARIALRENRRDEALSRFTSASGYSAGPEQSIFLNVYAGLLYIAGSYEASIKAFAEAVDLLATDEEKAENLKGQAMALISLGKNDDAKSLISEAWDLDGSIKPETYIWLFARIGEIERAREILADSQSQGKRIPASGFLALGDIENTFRVIKTGIEEQNVFILDSLRMGEIWDEIRKDNRFNDMLKLLDSMETHTEP